MDYVKEIQECKKRIAKLEELLLNQANSHQPLNYDLSNLKKGDYVLKVKKYGKRKESFTIGKKYQIVDTGLEPRHEFWKDGKLVPDFTRERKIQYLKVIDDNGKTKTITVLNRYYTWAVG